MYDSHPPLNGNHMFSHIHHSHDVVLSFLFCWLIFLLLCPILYISYIVPTTHDTGLSFISLNILLILCAAALMITPIFSVLLDIIVVVSCVPLLLGYLILLCCTLPCPSRPLVISVYWHPNLTSQPWSLPYSPSLSMPISYLHVITFNIN